MQCKAKTRSGDTCKNHPIKGSTVCRMHGGSSPRAKEAAARRLQEQAAEREVLKLAHPITVDPSKALLDLVHSTAGEVAYWTARVDHLQSTDEKRLTNGLTKVTEGKDRGGVTTLRQVEATPAVEYRMLVDAKNRLAQYASAALRAGVEERRVKLAESQGALVAQAIRTVLDGLRLTADQQALVPQVVPQALRMLTQ